jgi:hypothetical protein
MDKGCAVTGQMRVEPARYNLIRELSIVGIKPMMTAIGA